MHILYIYKDYPPVLGGIEIHIQQLAEGLSALGHRVTVLVTNTSAQDEIIKSGDLTIIKAARVAHLASTPLSPAMLWHARQLDDVDIMHLHFPYPPGDMIARAVPGKPPLVITYHSDIVRQRNVLYAYGPLLNRTLDSATRIIATSPNYIESSRWLKPRAERCVVIPHGVDLNRFARQDADTIDEVRARYGTPLMLFVGRLRYYKGLHFLLKAMTLMRTPAHLLLVGTGPEEQRLRTQVVSHKLEERVHFLGEVADAELPQIYGSADVFVLPSHLRAEAFGIVLIEAQAAGLPIVCTELQTGTSYVVQHGTSGFVVPPADPAALSGALDVLLQNPQMAQHMGAEGRSRAIYEFSLERMIEQVEQVYLEIVPEASSAAL